VTAAGGKRRSSRSRPRTPGERVTTTQAEPQFKPDAHCPDCGLCAPVRFTEAEVMRARREGQATRVQSTQCTRCGTRFWIRGGDIARSYLDTGVSRA